MGMICLHCHSPDVFYNRPLYTIGGIYILTYCEDCHKCFDKFNPGYEKHIKLVSQGLNV